jgi:uncharacterized protein (TIGR02466 family)
MKQASLFSTPVWVFDTDDNKLANKEIIESIKNGSLGPPVGVRRSNRIGRRYEFDIMKDVPKPITKYFIQCLKQVVKEDFLISIESWINLHEYGGYNISHIHPGYLISGVYYVQADLGAGSLVLEDPRPQNRYAANHVFLKNLDERSSIEVVPEEGKLILFPSWLEHHVTENQSSKDRVAISINVHAYKKPTK